MALRTCVFLAAPSAPRPLRTFFEAGSAALCGDRLQTVLDKRMHKLFPDIPPLSWPDLFASFKAEFLLLPASWQFALLRLWLGGWLTSRRLCLITRPCHFCGCAGGDRLDHLLLCSSLWSPILARRRCPVEFSALSRLDVLGLSDRLGPHRFFVPVAATFAQLKAHAGACASDALTAGILLALAGRPQRSSRPSGRTVHPEISTDGPDGPVVHLAPSADGPDGPEGGAHFYGLFIHE